jgi:predicted permease
MSNPGNENLFPSSGAIPGLELPNQRFNHLRILRRCAKDVRYTLRLWINRPVFTLVAVLSLGLGIGATTAIFTLMETVLLRNLPVERPQELERINGYFSYPMYRDLRDQNQVFSGLIAREVTPVNLATATHTERGVAELISGNYFSVLGVHPMTGRLITAQDDQTPMGHPVAVISYHYWRQSLSSDSGVIGKTIRVNSLPFTIIGVAPQEFFGVEVGSAPDLWIPIMMQPMVFEPGETSFENTGFAWLNLIGRRLPGISHSQAKAGISVTFDQVVKGGRHKLFRNSSSKEELDVEPGAAGFSRLRSQFGEPLYLLMAVVALVLLIACGNIANLLLAQSVTRRQEIGIRLALGATRTQLFLQLVTESLLLGLFSGAAGLAFAGWGVRVLVGFVPPVNHVGNLVIPLAVDVHTDAQVLEFTLLVSILTAVVFGLAPAIKAARTQVADSLKSDESATSGTSLARFSARNLLVISQVALSLVLVVGAGLFLKTLKNLTAVDTGLNIENVLLASLNPSLNGNDPQHVANFYQQLQARLEALPNVQAVASSSIPLLSGSSYVAGLIVPGRPTPPGPSPVSVLLNKVGGKYFQATGSSIIRGRDFNSQDNAASPKVAILSQAAALHFFDKDDPIGKRVRLNGIDNVEIIGIARDSKFHNVREQAPRIAYMNFAQDAVPDGERTIYLRSNADPLVLIPALRREIHTLDSNLPIYDLKTFMQQKNESLAQERLIATLSGFFGSVALLLASMGIYGVLSYSVRRRTREIGIRMSLGAARGKVLWMVLRECLLMVAAGMMIGVPLSLWLSRLAASQLFGLAAWDPMALGVAGLILILIAIGAGMIPALRASSVNPVTALRYE